jgi:2-dehydro-3-deoxyphosphogluconate aldolase/(4S)-4-hydroxy-2-oxoglutarate aldolase
LLTRLIATSDQPVLWLQQLRQDPFIAVIRHRDPNVALKMAQLALEAGLNQIEITSTVPQFAELIATLRRWHQRPAWIGAGTLTSQDSTTQALAAGAEFWVSPIRDPTLTQVAQEAGIPVVMGGLTPTEIWQAHQLGATAVKVFPVVAMGGASYLQQLRQPLAGIPLIPTGGVTLDNAGSYLRAGAIAVGIGSDLFPPEWLEQEDWGAIRQRIEVGIHSLRASQTTS